MSHHVIPSQPTPCHRRSPRWQGNLFLILFLLGAYLIPGAALLSPEQQYQQQENERLRQEVIRLEFDKFYLENNLREENERKSAPQDNQFDPYAPLRVVP